MSAEIHIRGPEKKPLVLSAKNYVAYGQDSLVFHCDDFAVKIYPDLTLEQVQKYQQLVNSLSDQANTESWNLQTPNGSQVPLRIIPALEVSKSPFEDWPLSISHWINGNYFYDLGIVSEITETLKKLSGVTSSNFTRKCQTNTRRFLNYRFI